MSQSPTHAFSGSRLGPELYVLSRPQIRSAREILASTRFDTLDGLVDGRPGDIAICGYGKECYPIKREVFMGAYEILGNVGHDFVAERLIHVRRAWEVLDAGGTFDYGPGRGVVAVERGSWLYESDDGDFGTIHSAVKNAGHVVAGPAASTEGVDWRARTERWRSWLCVLPPLLVLLALLAFVLSFYESVPKAVISTIIGMELLLMIAGGLVVAAMKRQRWFLWACVQTSTSMGREFESAAVLLGQAPSARFPNMALWRAAQICREDDPEAGTMSDDAAKIKSLRDAITHRLSTLEGEVARSHRREAVSSRVTLVAFCLVLAGNLTLLVGSHSVAIEMVVIWIPAVVSALHSFDLRRRTAERVTVTQQLIDRLRFALAQLMADGGTPGPVRDSILRLICLAVAQYTQRELRLLIEAEAPIPV